MKGTLRCAAVCACFAVLAGCATAKKQPHEPTAAEAPPPPPPTPPAPMPTVEAVPEPPPRTTARAAPPPPALELPCQKPLGKIEPVTLFYATNRARSGSTKAETFYGGDNARQLELGTLHVTIPPTHTCGKVESQLTDIVFGPNPNKSMVLKEVRPLSRSTYFNAVRQKVQGSPRREAFVFIHGYNNTFKEAALRAAELTFDLGFEGAPILFSWPSQGKAVAYAVDRAEARASAVHLRIFLNLLATQSGAEEIHVIVHSMGNYVFQNALSRDGRPDPIPALMPKLHEVVLAAADLGEDEVLVLAQALRAAPGGKGPHVTLYASEKDKALIASSAANRRQPIGLIKGMVPAIAGIDVIDATNLKCDFLAHSCFAEDPFSLLEMQALINQEWEAAKRAWIAAKDGHWYFCGGVCPIGGH